MKARTLAALGILSFLSFGIGIPTSITYYYSSDPRGKPEIIGKYHYENYDITLRRYSKNLEDTEITLDDRVKNMVRGIDEHNNGTIDGLTFRMRMAGEPSIKIEEVQRVYDGVRK